MSAGRFGWIWPVIVFACARTPPPAAPVEVQALPAAPSADREAGFAPVELPPRVGETVGLIGYAPDLWQLALPMRNAPHLDIAAAFGATGDWHPLCIARGDPPRPGDRDEVLGYLLAWCAIESGDRARGLRLLGQLGEARSLRVARAVAVDVVEALADAPGDDALETLRGAHLASPDNLGALANAYLALGRMADAAAVNPRELPTDHAPALRCRGLVRAYILRSRPRFELTQLIERDRGEPACDQARVMFNCPVAYGPWQEPAKSDVAEYDEYGCETLIARHPELTDRIVLGRVHALMPRGRDPGQWIAFARKMMQHQARNTLVANVIVTALERAKLESGYDQSLQQVIAKLAHDFGTYNDPRGFRERLLRLTVINTLRPPARPGP